MCICYIPPLPIITQLTQSQQTWCTTKHPHTDKICSKGTDARAHTHTHLTPPLNTSKGKRKELGAKQIKVINDNKMLLWLSSEPQQHMTEEVEVVII